MLLYRHEMCVVCVYRVGIRGFHVQKCAQNCPQDSNLKMSPRIPNLTLKSRPRVLLKTAISLYVHIITLHCTLLHNFTPKLIIVPIAPAFLSLTTQSLCNLHTAYSMLYIPSSFFLIHYFSILHLVYSYVFSGILLLLIRFLRI